MGFLDVGEEWLTLSQVMPSEPLPDRLACLELINLIFDANLDGGFFIEQGFEQIAIFLEQAEVFFAEAFYDFDFFELFFGGG